MFYDTTLKRQCVLTVNDESAQTRRRRLSFTVSLLDWESFGDNTSEAQKDRHDVLIGKTKSNDFHGLLRDHG
jgi:hypothetical protein